jgi:hypothetical protein
MTSWLSPVRWLVVGALIAALLAGYAFWARHQRETGRNEVRAEWTAEKLAISEASRQREKALTIATQGVDRAYQADKTRRAAADRITADRLRDFQSASAAASNDPAAACGTDEPYRAIANQCASALVVLDGYASEVAGKARALQGYTREVCVN